MKNEMIEVKNSFWSKLKKFFLEIILGNKNNLATDEKKSVYEIETKYNKGQKIEKEKIENMEKFMKENQHITEKSQNVKEKNKNVILKAKDLIVNGNNIKYSEETDGQKHFKKYVCIGKKAVSYVQDNNQSEKKMIIYGYNEYKHDSFTEKVRNTKLDKELSKTTKEDVTEIFERGPLLISSNDQYCGQYERRETNHSNGNSEIEENHKIIDENGNIQSITETYIHTKNKLVDTKYLNGKVVFQLVRDDEKGTIIKEYDDNGNVKDSYTYDKNGKPTEMTNIVGQDGKMKKIAKTYKGINHIPDDNGEFIIDEEYSNYLEVLQHAGLPQNINNIIDKSYEDGVAPFDFKDFEIAKKKMNQKLQNKTQYRENQEEMEK